MPITVTPIAGLSDHINDIRMRTGPHRQREDPAQRGRCCGAGAAPAPATRSGPQSKALRTKVQETVKSEGLWAPHLPPEYGGMGIDFLAHAYMNEILAYAVGAASLFGVVAPNSGNQTILAKYGTESRRRSGSSPWSRGPCSRASP